MNLKIAVALYTGPNRAINSKRSSLTRSYRDYELLVAQGPAFTHHRFVAHTSFIEVDDLLIVGKVLRETHSELKTLSFESCEMSAMRMKFFARSLMENVVSQVEISDAFG